MVAWGHVGERRADGRGVVGQVRAGQVAEPGEACRAGLAARMARASKAVILRIHLAAGLQALVKPDSRSVSPIVSVWRPQ
jgi:hypothetical protein